MSETKDGNGWRLFRLGSECEIITKGTTPNHRGFSYQTAGITYVKIESMGEDGKIISSKLAYIDEVCHQALKRSQIREGDLLFSIAGALGRRVVACKSILPANTNQAVAIIRLRDGSNLDLRFLFHYVLGPQIRAHIDRTNVQSAQANISLANVNEFFINAPPLPQQRKIARILTTLDNLITQTEALIAKYQAIKQGLMHDLFTRGVDATGKLRPPQSETPELYKQSELGWIPKEWEVCRLEAVSLAIVDCPHSTPEYLTDGVLVARTSQIKDGRFESVSASYVSELEYFVRVSRLEPRPDDVIFTREAPVGEAFVIPYGMRICLGQRVMLVRLDAERCEPHFFLQLIYTSKMRQRFDQQTGGTTNPHLNVVDIRELQIVVPALREQVAISRQMMKLVAKCNAEMQYLTKLRTTKSGLMQDLLTGKVRVNAEV